MNSSSFSQPPQFQNQSINPAMLSAFQNQQQQHQQQQHPQHQQQHAGGSQAAKYPGYSQSPQHHQQPSHSGGVNPMQLMGQNGMGGNMGAGYGSNAMGMPGSSHGGYNASQMNAQQQQQQQLMGMGGMNTNMNAATNNFMQQQLMNGSGLGDLGGMNMGGGAPSNGGMGQGMGINPSALSGGGMGMMGQHNPMQQQQQQQQQNPQSQQQQQHHHHHQQPGMNPMQSFGPGPGGGPSSGPSNQFLGGSMSNMHHPSGPSSSAGAPGGGGGLPMSGSGHSSSGAGPPHQQQNTPLATMLNMVGMTREQFSALSPHEKQITGNRMVALAQQRQQDQQNAAKSASSNSNPAFDPRPSSAASVHSNHGPSSSHPGNPTMNPQAHMMMPGSSSQQPSRPSTALSNTSGVMGGGRSQSPMQQHHGSQGPHPPGTQRPPSSLSNRGDYSQQQPHHSPMGDHTAMGIPYPDKPPTPSAGYRNGYMPGGAPGYHGPQHAGQPPNAANGMHMAGGGPPGSSFPSPQGQLQNPAAMNTPGSPYRSAKGRLGSLPPGTPAGGMAIPGLPGGVGVGATPGSMGPPAPMNRQMSSGSNASNDPSTMGMPSLMGGAGGMGMHASPGVGVGMGGGPMGMVNGFGPGGPPATPSRPPRGNSGANPMDMSAGSIGSPDLSRMNTAAPMMGGMMNGMGMGMNMSAGLGGGMGMGAPGMGGVGGGLSAEMAGMKTPFQQSSQLPRPGAPPHHSPVKVEGMGDRGSLPPASAGVVPPSVALPGVGVPILPPGASTSTQPPLGLNQSQLPNHLALTGPLPHSLDNAVTQTTIVPASSLPPLTDSEIADLKSWKARDKEYAVLHANMKERMVKEMKETLGRPMWWERGGGEPLTMRREGFDVRYPHQNQKRAERERKGSKRREGLKVPRRLPPKDANRPERLVPIRLEFDADHHKMRDTFVWNLNDPIVQPEHFAQSLIEDYQLPHSYRATITKSIEDQLADYKTHSLLYDADTGEPVNPDEVGPQHHGSLEDNDAQWWGNWRKQMMADYVLGRRRKRSERRGAGRKRRKADASKDADAEAEKTGATDGTLEETEDVKEAETAEETDLQERPMGLEDFPASVHMPVPEDLRILIKLDIMVGQMKLDDQFEWDLDNASPSPEQFADTYVQDLGLGGEFKTAIAHSIREQVQTYQKSLFLVGHPSDGTAVQDDELRLSFLPTLSSAARPLDQVPSFTPQLNHLSDGEIDRTEKDRDKDLARRRKRNTRGRRGIALPDREPIRTYRTPAIGFPELSAAAMALAVANNAPTSRRAAAAAAQLTIANMVATENGDRESYSSRSTPVPQQPQPMLPTAAKEKKTRGFFKPPEYPRAEVIRPRASVKAPTPSTAGEANRVAGLSDVEAAATPFVPISRIPNPKRQKELEREAKEKEFADTQHENMINGVWHCSNCGCPEGIAVGRRKGPLGDKSQCGACGKFWHRHRRPRPIEYNSSTQHHTQLQKDAESAKYSSRKKKAPVSNGPTEIASDPPTPLIPKVEIPPPAQMDEDDKGAPSPISTASSASEPLAAQPESTPAKTNGKLPPASEAAEAVEETSAPPGEPDPALPPPLNSTTSSESVPRAPPSTANNVPEEWLAQAMDALHTRFPNDRFDLTLRRPMPPAIEPEWRIKCLDCPGKLYKPGPGENMSNFEVHLKNRLHRQRVSDRITGVVTPAPATTTAPASTGTS